LCLQTYGKLLFRSRVAASALDKEGLIRQRNGHGWKMAPPNKVQLAADENKIQTIQP
jgi:hypothetical protein